ncbi:MAG TPA: RNA 2',3'-cyclic phosphodiesterase [Casimicrobiaceae bacterium]
MPGPAEATVRVFYALVPPPPLQRALAELAREIARRARGRPVPADNIHLTLAFIGPWPSVRLSLLLGVGEMLAGQPMRVTLDTQGGFRRAGVAWVGASSPPAALIDLASALARALAAAGVALEERPFHAHLTLARHCRGPYAEGTIGPLGWDVDDVALMQSHTRAEGARYERLARWPLRGAG